MPFGGVESRRDGRTGDHTCSFAPGGAWNVLGTTRPTIKMVGYSRLSLWDKTRTQPVAILLALDESVCATGFRQAELDAALTRARTRISHFFIFCLNSLVEGSRMDRCASGKS